MSWEYIEPDAYCDAYSDEDRSVEWTDDIEVFADALSISASILSIELSANSSLSCVVGAKVEHTSALGLSSTIAATLRVHVPIKLDLTFYKTDEDTRKVTAKSSSFLAIAGAHLENARTEMGAVLADVDTRLRGMDVRATNDDLTAIQTNVTAGCEGELTRAGNEISATKENVSGTCQRMYRDMLRASFGTQQVAGAKTSLTRAENNLLQSRRAVAAARTELGLTQTQTATGVTLV